MKEEAKEKPQVEKTSDKADFMSQLSQKLKQKSFREHSRSPVKQEKEEEEDNEEQLAPEVATKEKKKYFIDFSLPKKIIFIIFMFIFSY